MKSGSYKTKFELIALLSFHKLKHACINNAIWRSTNVNHEIIFTEVLSLPLGLYTDWIVRKLSIVGAK